MRYLACCCSLLLIPILALADEAPLEVTAESFGQSKEGREVAIFTLSNGNGIEARVTEFGATLVSLHTPDRNGKRADIVLGYDTLVEYEEGGSNFGATIGRYANRIGGAGFVLDDEVYSVTASEGVNTLHGGAVGFHKRIWTGTMFEDADSVGVELKYTSPGGEEGFPGTLEVAVRYTLYEAGDLKIEYTATTDAATHCNLTHHSYFNLAGHKSGDVFKQRLTIAADFYTPTNEYGIPTGEVLKVDGTALDLRLMQPIGLGLASGDPLVAAKRGYDHNFVLQGRRGELALAAAAWDPESGRRMEVWTDEPGLQFYSGTWVSGQGKDGARYESAQGFCLEPQHFPDSPNRPHFPSTALRPGERYYSRTVFRFGVE